MLAFKIEIDGKPYVVAGFQDWTLLGLDLMALRANLAQRQDHDTVDLSVRGICEQRVPGEHHGVRWVTRRIPVGTKITIEVCESDKCDAPIQRYRSDATVQEIPFTEHELREMRYQDYQRLRQEFETDG